MSDFLSRLRKKAELQSAEREKALREKKEKSDSEETMIAIEVADYLGVTTDEIVACCGSICPHCDTFLDKAIALEELGYKNHLFMNPVQEEFFMEALEIYRNDRKEYARLKDELINRMR